MSDDAGHVMSTGERLVYMVNQIARNLAPQGGEQAEIMVAEHIRAYWDPEMRRRIVELAHAERAALSPIAAAAIGRIAPR